jgi:hypothetical protein
MILCQHTASNDSRRSETLFTARITCTGNKAQGGAIGQQVRVANYTQVDSKATDAAREFSPSGF